MKRRIVFVGAQLRSVTATKRYDIDRFGCTVYVYMMKRVKKTSAATACASAESESGGARCAVVEFAQGKFELEFFSILKCCFEIAVHIVLHKQCIAGTHYTRIHV